MAASFPSATKTYTFVAAALKALPFNIIASVLEEITAIETWLRGGWTNITFSAGNYTASGSMTWTLTSPDQVAAVYRLTDPFTMQLGLNLTATSVGGTPSTQLKFTLPGGKVAAYALYYRIIASDNGTPVTAHMVTAAASGVVSFEKADGTNWSAATNATNILAAMMTIPITG